MKRLLLVALLSSVAGLALAKSENSVDLSSQEQMNACMEGGLDSGQLDISDCMHQAGYAFCDKCTVTRLNQSCQKTPGARYERPQCWVRVPVPLPRPRPQSSLTPPSQDVLFHVCMSDWITMQPNPNDWTWRCMQDHKFVFCESCEVASGGPAHGDLCHHGLAWNTDRPECWVAMK